MNNDNPRELPYTINLDIACYPSKSVPADILQAALNRGLSFQASTVAIFPDRSDWLFVLKDSEGSHIYTIGAIRHEDGSLSLHS
jgi:hypothetical protein